MEYKLKETKETKKNKTARYTLRWDMTDERQYEAICYMERKHQTTGMTYNDIVVEALLTKREYDKLSMDEKIECFQFGDISVDQARDIVSNYLNSIGYSSYFSEVYDESNRVSEVYGKQQQQMFVTREVQNATAVLTMTGMTKQQFSVADASMKAKLFDLASVDYKTGLQIYKGFLENIGVQKDVMEVYEE